jgi:RimJ/RimL family protein N-acetyltransferase
VDVPLEFRTARLELRRLTRAHLDDLVELDADPEVMRFISGGVPNPRSLYESEILARMTGWDDEPFGFLAVYEGDTFQGWFHLRPSVADATVLELGYRLRRAAWGRGLATEGALALLTHAFDTLDQPAVDACAHPDNAASIHVLQKCGMRFVGTFMHPRVPLEVVRYLVDREQWRARGPA